LFVPVITGPHELLRFVSSVARFAALTSRAPSLRSVGSNRRYRFCPESSGIPSHSDNRPCRPKP
jgi:hypothetical protein